MNIAMTSIPVNDPIAAFKFYTEVLGFKERLYMPEMYLAIVVSPEDPQGTGLLLEPNSNPVSKTYQEAVYNMGLPLIVFGVDDIQKEYERLKSRGVVFKQEPTKSEAGIEAVLDDTCGNFVQLFQFTMGS
jgi:predicted enzyme related to lactoylglutathione lyase